jgi:solute:Na+ symporter, SSS family
VLGILWPRLNASGAITSLLTGFVLGATRFVLELADKGSPFTNEAVRWIVDMNFLHYAIFMFVVCSLVLVVVSMMTPAPERKQLAGLTFATVDDKIETTIVGQPQRKPAHETPTEHWINVIASLLLLGTVISLWVYFR